MTCSSCSMVMHKVDGCNETLEDGVLRIAGSSVRCCSHSDSERLLQEYNLGDDTVRGDGPIVVVVETIARFLKARPVFVNDVEDSFGVLEKDGLFNGALGYIERKEADIFGAPAGISSDRNDRFDVHGPLSSDKIHFFTIKPDLLFDPWGFIRTFEPTIWLLLLGTLLVLPICTAFLHTFDGKLPGCNPNKVTRGILGYIWFWFAIIFPQPDFTPRSVWLRACAAMFMLSISLMLMTLFEADLKGSLVFKKEADNVNYFSDVLRTRDMRIITERNSMASSIFTASQNLFLKALRQRLDKREGILAGYNFDLLLKEILDRKAVVITTGTPGKVRLSRLAQQTGRCPSIKVSDGHIRNLILSILMGRHIQKHVRERIQSAVIRVAESAVFEQKLQSQWYLADRCKSRPRESLEALHVFDFEGVFYLLFIGVAASTLGLVSELLLARTQRDPNRHNQ
ncbi:uncharacterized protein LOC111262769 [Varroa jacobsoni]|uniref:Ionotropic glutamate receptor C-terminal domain-containing protein n=1 Tax=Varroa destructor TaxID=109461 RepID=A0A7M7M8T8_VARDE|nr:uncharacterized protein LOC111243341 [Varroa destructor]XP_022693027.1 uncharacterized protein LOC111262769 [Varroa jacobsoni]